MATVLAIDVGSSAVRSALYDSHGRALRESWARHEYRSRTDVAGASEVDAEELLRVTSRCITESMRAAKGAVAGVGVSTFWHGLLGGNEQGEAVTPLYLWSDRRAAGAAEALRGRVDAEALRQRTGCPIHSSYWPAKLWWLRSEHADLWRAATRWMSFGDLLFMRLFGTFATSLSMASATGLLRLDTCEWDADVLGEVRIDSAALPAIGVSEQGLRPPYRRRWPALAGVPWFHAAGDGALANLGSGCVTPRRRSVTIGTSAAVRVIHRAPAARAIPPGLWRYRLDRPRLVTGGALSSGGNVRDWLLRELRLDDADLERALLRESPGSHGLAVLPYLAGERSPGYAPNATGAIRGLTLATQPLQVARAAVESVTIELARVNRLLDEACPAARVLVASGGALLESPAWMQLVADATARQVVAGRAREASSRGAALFALERLGLANADDSAPRPGGEFRPRRAATAAFVAAAERQAALYAEVVTNPR